MSEVTLSDEIQLPRLDSLADIPYAQETPASWDPDYRKIWQELQVANRNKTQLGGHIRELRSRLSQAIAQRDEGLAREAELQKEVARMTSAYQAERARRTEGRAQNDALQQRLAEAKRLLLDVRGQLCGPDQRAIDVLLASSDCADGEKAPAPSVNLPRRKVKTEYSTAEEDAQADAWNAALDAVQELSR